MMHQVNFIDIGLTEYKEAWDFQEKELTKIQQLREHGGNNPGSGTLIFCEHPHVYTLGKSGQQNNLLINEAFLKNINATYYQSNRGGDITYHGPGQIVGYPIFDLEKLKIGVKEYISLLEESVIRFLKIYGITSSRLSGATGVWLDADTQDVRKICAIGVRVSRAVTMHGFALNVNPDLKYFSYINPCGLGKAVTSMQKELGSPVDFDTAKSTLKEKITELFGLTTGKGKSMT